MHDDANETRDPRRAAPSVPGQPPVEGYPIAGGPQDYRLPDEPEPWAQEGESIAWMADSTTHLSDVEPAEVPVEEITGPLPVCDYTGDDGEPCEEPAVQRRWSSTAIIIAAAFSAVAGGLLTAAIMSWATGLVPGVQPLLQNVAEAPERLTPITISPSQDAETAIAVAAKATPAVVNVGVETIGRDPFTGQFRQGSGNGSGVMIRDDGHIITNYHVIEGAERIVVTVGVEDKEAEVVGTDPQTDLAVLKVDGTDYPTAQIGTSEGLEVGQFVMAVGSPFGLEKTVTSGIISALQRSQLVQGAQDLTTYTNLIQTDAAINPGNSGGALVNAEGELIGINTLIESPSGAVGAPQSAGIGFAIPIDLAMNVAEQLIEKGSADHPYLGVSTETIDEVTAQQFALPVESGAIVRFVQPGSPAEVAGVEVGDIIVTIDGRRIEGVEDVFAAIRANDVGTEIEVVVVRGDAERTLSAQLGTDAERQ